MARMVRGARAASQARERRGMTPERCRECSGPRQREHRSRRARRATARFGWGRALPPVPAAGAAEATEQRAQRAARRSAVGRWPKRAGRRPARRRGCSSFWRRRWGHVRRRDSSCGSRAGWQR
eukprot:2121082-Prymnesium_polylepis.2